MGFKSQQFYFMQASSCMFFFLFLEARSEYGHVHASVRELCVVCYVLFVVCCWFEHICFTSSRQLMALSQPSAKPVM